MPKADVPLYRRPPLVLYSFIAVLVVFLFLGFLVLRPFLVTFTVSTSVAILLAPLNIRLIRILGGRRGLAAALLVVFTAFLILVPLLSSVVIIGDQAAQVLRWLEPRLEPEVIERLWAETLPERYPVLARLKSWLGIEQARVAEVLSPALSELAGFAGRLLRGLLGNLARALLELVLFLIVLFFLVRDGHLLGKALSDISPLSEERDTMIYEHLSRTVKGVLQALVLVPVAQGILATIGFYLFGLPAPLFWGAILVLAAVIPGIGSPLVWVPAAVYLFFAETAGQGIGLALYGTLVVSTSDNIIKPLILREAARIHPLLAFMAIFGGLLSFGLPGFLIGPVILSVVLSALRIYRLEVLQVTPEAEASPVAALRPAPPGTASNRG
jgi:predicted PurR-regulated permease PerM